MLLKFTKMHGCGNDYIYFDCMDGKPPLDPHALGLFALCDRNRGIGGDGIVLILPSDVADGRMVMYNRDGSEGLMCGNAIRCVAEFLHTNSHAPAEMTIETASGIKHLKAYLHTPAHTLWQVDMGAAQFCVSEIDEVIAIDHKAYRVTRINMGNPHAVVFMDEIDNLELQKIGPLFEHAKVFAPERTNTEFVQVIARNHLKMRVWERGSGETLACGTGACAAAVAAVLNGHCDKNADIKIDLLGGQLTVKYADNTVIMTGEAVKVYEGTLYLRH